MIATSGSRGELQPYLAIALALQAAGHQILFASEERMKSLVESFGLEFFKIAGDPTAILWTKEAQVALRDGKVFQIMKQMKDFVEPFYQQTLIDYEAACQNVDCIVSGQLCITQTYCIAEKLKLPWVPVILGPSLKNGEFPMFFVSQTNLYFEWLNKLTYNVIYWALWQDEKEKINKWRTEKLGLVPITNSLGMAGIFEDQKLDVLLAFNRNVIPGERVPADWPPNYKICGFLFVPKTPEENIDPKLRAFMNTTEGSIQPVYLGFGSMPAPNPLLLVELAIKLTTRLQVRTVICAGWSELSEIIASPDEPEDTSRIRLPSEVIIVKEAPHDWLLQRCSAIVHHCGVGTSAAALRSGVPSVPCPVMLDQPFFASRLYQLGCASEPIPFQKLDANNLCTAVNYVLKTKSVREKAAEIAREIAIEEEEKGTKMVVSIIEQLRPPPHFLATSPASS